MYMYTYSYFEKVCWKEMHATIPNGIVGSFECTVPQSNLKECFSFYIVQLFVFFHSLSVHLKSDRLQHGIIMCSMVYLAFDPNTNNW